MPENIMGKEFVGVDPGLAHMGLAVVRVSPWGLDLSRCLRVNTYTNKPLGHRLEILVNAIEDCITENTAGIGCESPSFGSKSAPYSLGSVHGLVHLIAYRAELPVIKVAPVQLHKFTTGHVRGRGPTKKAKSEYMKEQVRVKMNETFGFDYSKIKHSDPVDASALATIAAAFFGDFSFNDRHKMEVLAAVKPYDNFN